MPEMKQIKCLQECGSIPTKINIAFIKSDEFGMSHRLASVSFFTPQAMNQQSLTVRIHFERSQLMNLLNIFA